MRTTIRALALTDETPGSAYWYTAGVNRAGVIALVAGTAAAALYVSTQLGPLARTAGESTSPSPSE
ncbi:hypothetical protein ACIQWV_21855 [Streptomyces sp. NPDC098085]|uniref:hypothetical protein n=1 Tax=Streptomyces sp. NPDC098085 TaxID=3366094 RepID=UPI0038217315